MAITLARGLASSDIRCPECNGVRTVDPRHARDWRQGRIAGTCARCRSGSATRVARDRDVGFWLKQYGVTVPKGTKAREVLAASGLPADLAEFARSCFPD